MSHPPLVRSFIAIPLSAGIKSTAAAIQDRLKPSLPGVRWTKPETMHLTLHFFGDLDHVSLDKAGAVMVSIESLFQPFSMALSGVGGFPSANRARVLWLGLESDRLGELHAVLNKELRRAGFACEARPFKPHITLGRSRGGPQKAGHILSQENSNIAGEMTVDSLVLFASELQPTGAVHRPRQTIHFSAD